MHRALLSSVSHDLKTPLSSIIGSLEIFQSLRGTLSQKHKEQLLATALEEAYRLDNFITNILDMAKLESGAIKPVKRSAQMHHILEDCVMHLGRKLDGIEITIKQKDNPIEIITDAALLCRALFLLVDNAVNSDAPAVFTADLRRLALMRASITSALKGLVT